MVNVVDGVKMVKFLTSMWKLMSRGSENFLCKQLGLHLITS